MRPSPSFPFNPQAQSSTVVDVGNTINLDGFVTAIVFSEVELKDAVGLNPMEIIMRKK